jgi:serine/threonine-protein kinase
MSPEQSAGERTRCPQRIYALGTVLYEMLAGEPPYTGPSRGDSGKRLTEPLLTFARYETQFRGEDAVT